MAKSEILKKVSNCFSKEGIQIVSTNKHIAFIRPDLALTLCCKSMVRDLIVEDRKSIEELLKNDP